LGEDADTTGAVCGQLAGAYWGESGVPDLWLTGLVERNMIEDMLQGLIGQHEDAHG
jgi:ADP-ribosyl-[dinitrogen reductase] hydrolase